ncbi:MAG: ATP-binding protein [Synergistetes bacterium]|nr:ATP-binding protein [Synergistota bacterium]MCX8127517.1 ATP-binding protein [Synergistota bacterium]MDW8191566.1 ATP-binding protein [Synergistota bacterium]
MRWRDKFFLFLTFLLSIILVVSLASLKLRLLVVSIALLVFNFLFYRIEKKLKHLRHLLSYLKLGDYRVRIFVDSDDEISKVFSEINELARYMELSFKEGLKKEEKLKALFDLLDDPVVLIDEVGRIVEANRSFYFLLEKDSGKEFKGRWYWELFRDGNFFELFSLIKEKGSVRNFRLSLKDRVFLSNGSLLKSGLLICLKEITEEVRLRERESNLISSIAHEIKTPLAAIKGAAETLEEEIGENRLLSIVKRNVERLTKIVSDLLTLQEVEREIVRKESLNLIELIKDVLSLLEGEAKRKGISLILESPEEKVFIEGDRILFESAFLNLIENAIKYNVEGGSVKVIVEGSKGAIKVVVEDTGIGIPKEHIPYIFEKFYVVDRSRSKRLGGAGLGLSIVKEVVSLHGGRVEVESEFGKGSRFTLTFPA